MDSVQILKELAEVKEKLLAVERELIAVASQTREVTDFISTMKQVVNEMSENPMFRAMGISPITTETKDVPRLPGMHRE